MLAKNRPVEQNLGLGSSSPEICLWWRYQKFGSSTDSKRSRRHRQACCESLALHGQHVAPPWNFSPPVDAVGGESISPSQGLPMVYDGEIQVGGKGRRSPYCFSYNIRNPECPFPMRGKFSFKNSTRWEGWFFILSFFQFKDPFWSQLTKPLKTNFMGRKKGSQFGGSVLSDLPP